MAEPIKFLTMLIDGKPVPQERPLVTRNGTFDRPKSRAEKRRIGFLAIDSMRHQNWVKTASEVCVYLLFCGAHGGSDIDNLSKLVLDALKGIVWDDDRQVVKISADKRKLLDKHEVPGTLVLIWEGK